MGFFKDRSDYFKNLSHNNKTVAHDRLVDGEQRTSFFRMNDEEELTAACVNWAHFPCVVHFGFNGRYTSESAGVPKRRHNNSLLFLQKADQMDMNSIEAAYDTALEIMEQFISSMYNEFVQKGYCSNFDNLDLGRFNFTPYGPLNATLYGWELVFEDDRFANDITQFDPSNWFS